MIEIAKYTAGTLTTDDYVFMLRQAAKYGWNLPCPIVEDWQKKEIKRHYKEEKIHKGFGKYNINDEDMRWLEAYGNTTGIY